MFPIARDRDGHGLYSPQSRQDNNIPTRHTKQQTQIGRRRKRVFPLSPSNVIGLMVDFISSFRLTNLKTSILLARQQRHSLRHELWLWLHNDDVSHSQSCESLNLFPFLFFFSLVHKMMMMRQAKIFFSC